MGSQAPLGTAGPRQCWRPSFPGPWESPYTKDAGTQPTLAHSLPFPGHLLLRALLGEGSGSERDGSGRGERVQQGTGHPPTGQSAHERQGGLCVGPLSGVCCSSLPHQATGDGVLMSASHSFSAGKFSVPLGTKVPEPMCSRNPKCHGLRFKINAIATVCVFCV